MLVEGASGGVTKPRLRGWIHLYCAVVAVIAGTALVAVLWAEASERAGYSTLTYVLAIVAMFEPDLNHGNGRDAAIPIGISETRNPQAGPFGRLHQDQSLQQDTPSRADSNATLVPSVGKSPITSRTRARRPLSVDPHRR